MLTIDENKLRKLIYEEVKKALFEFLEEMVPYVDDSEQKEIEEILGTPDLYTEDSFVDLE